MTKHRMVRASGLIILLALATLASGCDGIGFNGYSLNIVLPLGLGGSTGLLNPTGSSTIWGDDFDNSTTPIQVGDGGMVQGTT